MLAALTFDDILRRTPPFGTPENPTGARLVSIVFANPGSGVWDDLVTNRAFLDERSGNKWDLFFAGMSAYGPSEPDAQLIRQFPRDPYSIYHNPRHFGRIEREVLNGLQGADSGLGEKPQWRYSGGTDLVSFMCYGGAPDWLSLATAVDLENSAKGRLGVITEELREWSEPEFGSELAPGSRIGHPVGDPGWLVSALGWSANSVAGGALGNAAWDLIKKLLR